MCICAFCKENPKFSVTWTPFVHPWLMRDPGPVDWLQLSLSSLPKQNMSCSNPVRNDSALTEKRAAALCTLSRHTSPCSSSLSSLCELGDSLVQ